MREALWERCLKRADGGTVLQLWSAPTEQGFDLRAHKPKGRIPIKREGIWLPEVVDPDPRRTF